jgi:hypothetical protein
MCEQYALMTKKNVLEQSPNEPLEDMVSYAEINPTGRNYISYLRLVDGIPTRMVYWDTVSCINTFINHPTYRTIHHVKHIVDPETNQPIHTGFIERIQLYNESINVLGTNFSPTPREINDIFQRYLREGVSDRDKLVLRSFLFLEDTEVLTMFEATGLQIRVEAEKRLLQSECGSYLLRTSSVVDSELVKAKVLSFNDNGVIKHVICIHARGYGYYIPSGIKPEQIMPDLTGEKRTILPLPSHGSRVYACFVDWLEMIYKSCNVVKSRYIS